MQLTKPGAISLALHALTANLFVAVAADAQDTRPPSVESAEAPSVNSDLANDQGLTRLDSAILFYQEAGGRIRATEPVVSGVLNGTAGETLSVRIVADSLTGATPNGAAPWTGPQTFTTPANKPGSTTTVTTASGGSTLVTLPGSGLTARQYTTPAGQLPVDAGFRDERIGVDGAYSTPIAENTRVSVGGAYSAERDYRSGSLNAGITQDLNQKNTTLSLSANVEFDRSFPYFGTPTPLTEMSAAQKGPAQTKTVYSLVAGVTQVMNRHWLTQLSYSYGDSSGYQTDPYRILSVVDPTTGAPLTYLYESRPRSRTRQSLYWSNKIALGPTVTEISARGYEDSWGVKSITAEISERVPITSWLYVEPQARYYSQSAADFFRSYLISGQALPAYASSDSRLGKFDAETYGLKLGMKVGGSGEFYVLGEDYQQNGRNGSSTAPGGLAILNTFTGVKATSIMVGYTFAFY